MRTQRRVRTRRGKKERNEKKAGDRPRVNTACPEMNGCCAVRIAKRWLLELDLCAGGLELLLDLLRLLFGGTLLDGLGCALDEVLGLLESEPGDGANFLDGADLVRARLDEDDGELGLLLDRRGGGSGGGRGGRGNGRGGGDALFGLEVFHETGDFENRLAGKPLDDLFLGDVAHGDLLSRTSAFEPEVRLRDVSPSLRRWMLFSRGRRPAPPVAGKWWWLIICSPPWRGPSPAGR